MTVRIPRQFCADTANLLEKAARSLPENDPLRQELLLRAMTLQAYATASDRKLRNKFVTVPTKRGLVRIRRSAIAAFGQLSNNTMETDVLLQGRNEWLTVQMRPLEFEELFSGLAFPTKPE